MKNTSKLMGEVVVRLIEAFDGCDVKIEGSRDEHDGAEYVVSVISRFDPEETIARLHRFDTDWWYEAAKDTDAIIVTTDIK